MDAGLKDELVFGDPEAPRFVFWEGRLRPVPGGPAVRRVRNRAACYTPSTRVVPYRTAHMRRGRAGPAGVRPDVHRRQDPRGLGRDGHPPAAAGI